MSLETATQTVKDAQQIKARLQVLESTLPKVTLEDLKKSEKKVRRIEKGLWTLITLTILIVVTRLIQTL